MANIHREIHRVIPPRPASNRAPLLSDRFPLGRARIVADPVPPSSSSAVTARKNRFIMVASGVRVSRRALLYPAPGVKKEGQMKNRHDSFIRRRIVIEKRLNSGSGRS